MNSGTDGMDEPGYGENYIVTGFTLGRLNRAYRFEEEA
jgi:hypothetical protein